MGPSPRRRVYADHRAAPRGTGPREIVVETGEDLYAIEADTVAAHLAARQAPVMTWDDTLGNMKTLDRWRAAIGLVYDVERPEATPPVSGRPLAMRADHPIPTGRIAGVDKPVSRLIMGVDNQTTMPHAAVMFDDFFERGGTCFDTAYIYGGGVCERLLGQWIANRGVREQVVILDKGAHTPFCTPDGLTRQLLESLDRLTKSWRAAGTAMTTSTGWSGSRSWRGGEGSYQSTSRWPMCCASRSRRFR